MGAPGSRAPLAPGFLTPVVVEFQMGDRHMVVKPANVGRLARMLADLGPFLAELVELPADVLQRMAGEGPTTEDVLELLQRLSGEAELPLRLVAHGTDLTLKEVEALPFDQFAYLFAVVVQVNADFFVRAMPLLGEAAQRLATMVSVDATASQTLTPPGPSSSTN